MLNAVVDVSHYNTISSIASVQAAGILGIIQKATQGVSYQDPTFAANRQVILGAGLLFGSYHFGTAGDADAQADFYLTTTNAQGLLVLDFEGNPQGQDMSLLEAEQFVHHVFAATGRYPGLYSGHTLKEALANAGIKNPNDTELSKCWLWISQYASAPLIPSIWPTWTLWQYTNGATGPTPHDVDGIGLCDRDQYNGTSDDLTAFWAANS